MNNRVYPSQVSADDTLDVGTGMRPVSPIGRDMFVPPTIVQESSTPALSDTPNDSVTIKYMSPTGIRVTHVTWREGLTVVAAFKTARAQDSVFRLLRQPVANYTRKVNGRRVRLNYRLQLGDMLQLIPATPMS